MWNAASATLLRTLEGHTGPVSAVAVSRDDSRVATGSRDGTARVWDIATGHALRSVPHEGPVVDVVFDPGGRRLLTLDAENTVRMWDVATGDALPGLPHGIRATALAFSADGERIVVATEDDSLQVLGAESGEPIRTFQGHAGPVLAVAFSIDGMLLASTSEDGTAKVWDRSSGRLLATFPHEGSVTAVSFSGDGTRLATASKDRAARQWHDGARLATASTDQTAWLWSLEPQRWLPWGCAVLDGRRAHSEITRRACARATASELVPSVSEIVVEPSSRITAAAASVPEAGKPAPDLITVHGVELVLVPGGTFTMGSPSDEYGRSVIEGPQHEVTLASFYLARTELTNAQYALYLEANPDGRAPPFGHYERYNKPEQPVVGLSWDDAKAYCDWAGLSLPTEAQWEYAARAGSTTAYWFGHEADDLERFGWTVADAAGSMERSRTHSVGTKGPNPWGLYDMHGNVWEWCLDGYAPYPVGVRAADGLRRRPAGIVHRVLRGGSFVYWPDAARSAVRFRSRPGNHTRDVGFRPAMRLP